MHLSHISQALHCQHIANGSKGGVVAQRVEHWTCDQQVVGSNPTREKVA